MMYCSAATSFKSASDRLPSSALVESSAPCTRRIVSVPGSKVPIVAVGTSTEAIGPCAHFPDVVPAVPALLFTR